MAIYEKLETREVDLTNARIQIYRAEHGPAEDGEPDPRDGQRMMKVTLDGMAPYHEEVPPQLDAVLDAVIENAAQANGLSKKA